MFFFKDGKIIVREEGFRWATFTVQSDERPLTDAELKNSDYYELASIDNDESWEMVDMTDGCWADVQKGNDKTTDEDLEEFNAAWEEDWYSGVEAKGWSQDECEYYFYGPLELTNEDTGEVFQGEPEENVSVSGVPAMPESPDLTMEEKIEILHELEVEKSLLTEWYPASINPYRVGTYQVLHGEYEEKWPFPSNVRSAVWDGKKWDDNSVVQWRGLTEEVK